MRQKGFVLLPALIVLVALAAIVTYFIFPTTKTNTKVSSNQESATTLTTEASPDFIRDDSCDKLGLNTYYVNNDFNKYQFCYPIGWRIKDWSARNYIGQHIDLTGEKDEDVITVRTRIYTNKEVDYNSPERFQFTNIDFEQSKDIQGNASNPQFKIGTQSVFENTKKVFHIDYSYKVYIDFPESNHEHLWIIKGGSNPNVYYELGYGYMSNWNTTLTDKNKDILKNVVETFRN